MLVQGHISLDFKNGLNNWIRIFGEINKVLIKTDQFYSQFTVSQEINWLEFRLDELP